jgi:uncharacterized protein (TIGR03437 family)
MNRRSFVRIGAAGVIGLPDLPRRLLAEEEPSDGGRTRVSPLVRAPDLVRKKLSSRVAGFPTIQPTFGGIFQPGGNSTKLISANGFSDLYAQINTLAGQGYQLASLTAIQNMNSTWYYAAFEPASGGLAYLVLGTTDPDQFQQFFSTNQSGYKLVDFAITWEQTQLFYVGYWLGVSTPANQTLVWDLDYTDLTSQWTSLSGQGMRMTRIQPFPQQSAAAFSALFEAGTGGYVLWNTSLPDFPGSVTGKWAGYSLAGLGYDLVNGNMVGCWRGLVNSAQFVWNQDWTALQATAQQMAANGLVLTAISAYPNAPDFDDYFSANLAPFVMGYAYAVSKNGQLVSEGYGLARGPNQPNNPNTAFTPTSRINLASISKAVTGIALEVMLPMYPSITLDSPFWPLISSMVPSPDPSVKVVTLRNLATMMSGMQTPPVEGPLSGNLWPYLNTYLSMPLVGTPGVTYSYNNENFTILQGVIDQVTNQDYVSWVTKNVLVPAGIDTSIFNATSDPQATATLGYNGPADTRDGAYFGSFNFVAPGGWISDIQELVKILLALRGTSVIPAATVNEMLTDGIGWFSYAGNFGTYYDKNGGLTNGATPSQNVNTCLVRLAEGYDIALVANSQPPIDVVNICAGAFDSRGLLTKDQPPAIATVISAATLLPGAAPAGYCTIMGSGFTDQAATDWSSSISGSQLPTAVGGIQVNVNRQPAYVEYISAAQVNFLLPQSAAVGTAEVELVTPTGVMTSVMQIAAVSPGIFTYTLAGVVYAASVFATGSGVVYVAAPGALPGYTSRPAAAGDIIELYATGCGTTNPVAPDGVVLTQAYPAANLSAFQVTIAGTAAAVLYAGLVSPGLWQINVQIPSGLIGGPQALVLSVNNIGSQPAVKLMVLGG